MSWYNPLSWFRDNRESIEETKLYCDNPQCRLILEQDIVAYDEDNKEIYHNGSCAQTANAHRVSSSGKPGFQTVYPIDLDEAVELLKSGKLKQSQGLEKKARD